MSKALPDHQTLSAMVRDVLAERGIDNLAAIYMFGSAAADRLRPDSDVDLIDLRRASTVMRMQVITGGRRILTLDPVETDTFEMYAFSDYARLQEERAPVHVRAVTARARPRPGTGRGEG